MSAGTSLAPWKARIFESVLGFPPDRVQIAVLALVVLVVVAYRAVRIKRRVAHRRATRAGRPVHAAARYGQGSGADHLGQYAPQPGRPAPHAPEQVTAGQSGADFLGGPRARSAASGRQPGLTAGTGRRRPGRRTPGAGPLCQDPGTGGRPAPAVLVRLMDRRPDTPPERGRIGRGGPGPRTPSRRSRTRRRVRRAVPGASMEEHR
ncbi:hypothetical protein ACWZEH_04950 [Streptomyces sp. QTS137]